MGRVNDTRGQVYVSSQPYAGTATISWLPMSKISHRYSVLPAPQSFNVSLGGAEPKAIIEISGAVWNDEAKPPFSYFVIEHPPENPNPLTPAEIWGAFGAGLKRLGGATEEPKTPAYNIKTTIYVFVAPHLTVVENTLDSSLFGGNFEPPSIQIVRTNSHSTVPSPGTEINIADYIGTFPIHWHAMLDDHEEPRFAPLPFTARYNGHELILSPNQFGIYPPGYEIRILRPKYEPSLVQVAFWPSTVQDTPDHFVVRATKNVSVEHNYHTEIGVAFIGSAKVNVITISERLTSFRKGSEKSFSQDRLIFEGTSWLGPKLGADPFGSQSGEIRPLPVLGEVIFRDTLSDLVPLPFDSQIGHPGDGIDEQERIFLPGTHNVILRLTISLGIGLVPVLGTIFDLAEIAKVSITGTDFWNQEVSDGELSLMCGFAVIGVFCDVDEIAKLGKEFYGPMKRVADGIFPNYLAYNVNPGFYRSALEVLMANTSPAFQAAARIVLGELGAQKLVNELDEAARLVLVEGSSDVAIALLEKIAKGIDGALTDFANKTDVQNHPAFLDAARHATLDRMPVARAALDEVDFPKIKKILDKVRNEIEPGSIFAQLNSINPNFATLWQEEIRHIMRSKLRENPQILTAYNSYLAKSGKSPADISFFDYALKISRGGVRSAIKLIFGTKGIEFMVGKNLPVAEMSIEQILVQKGAIDAVNTLLVRIDSYEILKEQIELYAKGKYVISEDPITYAPRVTNLGKLLESDHLLEARFRVRAVAGADVLSSQSYASMLVPATQEVADELSKYGIDGFFYVHKAKTERMRQLIPHGREVEFSIQTIADVYMSFWVYEMRMDISTFKGLFGTDLARLAMESGEDAPNLNLKTAEQLSELIGKRRLGLESNRVFEKEMSIKASSRPME